ncbi:MAG: hypothetical protein LC798_13130 [Chloroflexi bacterium]|nr:hypothetical protein [Chloroflexota bacterium]
MIGEGAGLEIRFLPVGGGEAKVFLCRYELVVEPVSVAEADARGLADLDTPEQED